MAPVASTTSSTVSSHVFPAAPRPSAVDSPPEIDARQIGAPAVSPGAPAPAAPQAAVPARPPQFVLQPTTLSIPPPDEIIATLAQGRPFPDDFAQLFLRITGRTITAGGLEALFERTIPAAACVVSDPRFRHATQAPNIMIGAIDRHGLTAFEVVLEFKRHVSGHVEVNYASAFAAPAYRGSGISARGEILLQAIVKTLSPHPDTHFSQQAGSSADVNTGRLERGTGCLVNAQHGYLFGDTFDVTSDAGETDAHCDDAAPGDTDATLMARQFASWRERAQLEKDGAPASAAAHAALQAAADAATQPWHYLRLPSQVTALAYGPEGKAVPMPVGVAYCLSGEAPLWRGIRFVNDTTVTRDPTRDAWRRDSAQCFAQQTQRELARAAAAIEARTERTWRALYSANADERARAYHDVALWGPGNLSGLLQARLSGPPKRRERLQARLWHGKRPTGPWHDQPRETHPTGVAALEAATAAFAGIPRRDELRRRIADTAMDAEERHDAELRLEILEATGR